MRVSFSEAIVVQNRRTTFVDGPVDHGTVNAMNYGDRVFLVDPDAPPPPGTITTRTVSGQRREGTRVERSITLPVPSPTRLHGAPSLHPSLRATD